MTASRSRALEAGPSASRSFPVLVFVLLASLPAGAVVDSSEVGPGLHFENDDGIASAPLVGSLVHLRVTGVVARASVTQIFRNPTDRTVEATYVFPLPAEAAVDSMRMKVGERVLTSRIKSTPEARRTFAEARESGRKASLLEVVGDGVFTARVTRLGAGESVEIEIGLQMVVGFDLDTFHLRFPLVLERKTAEAPRALPVALRADVAPGFEVSSVTSRSHDVVTRREPGLGTGGFSVELAAEVEDADRDFELAWRPARGHLPRAAAFVEESGGERYALVMVIPPRAEHVEALRLPRETVFVVDTSGSMKSGRRLPQAVEALRLALGRLRPEDRFQILRFSDDVEGLFDGTVAPSQPQLDRARRFVGRFEARGGTEATPALREALSYPPTGYLRQVVLLTDGNVENEPAALRAIGEHLGTSRLFPIAIGHAPNRRFLERVAELGRGTTAFLAADDEIKDRMGSVLRKLEEPVLQDVEVTWDAVDVSARPSPVPDLYSGEPLVLAARIGDATEVTLRGRLRDRQLELTLPLPASAGSGGAGLGLRREWARRQIDHLLAVLSHPLDPGGDVRPEDRDAAIEEVTDLGLRHCLVTPYTSLVAEDPVASADDGPQEEVQFAAISPKDIALADVPPADVASVAETLVVSARAPRVDARRISCGHSFQFDDTEIHRGTAWALALSAPGVSGRHAGMARADSGAPGEAPRLATPSTGTGQVTWSLDGAPMGDLESIAVPHAALTLGPRQELDVLTAGPEPALAHPGVHVDLTTTSSGNTTKIELSKRRLVDVAGSGEDDPGRWTDGNHLGANLAGPLLRDRLWATAFGERRDAARTTLGGQVTGERLEARGVRLDALWDGTDLRTRWRRGERRAGGLGAGPSREPAATLGLEATADSWQVAAGHVPSASVYLLASHGQTRGQGVTRSGGGPDATPRWTRSGRFQGGALGHRATRDVVSNRLEGAWFLEGSSASHELELGARQIDLDDAARPAGPGTGEIHVAGPQLGAGAGIGYVVTPAGDPDSRRIFRSSWLNDGIDVGDWHLSLGLRWDEQLGTVSGGGVGGGGTGLRWRTLSPRLAAARSFGPRRQHVARASWSRYADRLSRSVLAGTLPGTLGSWLGLPSVAELRRFHDADGDGLRQAGEAAEPWHVVPFLRSGEVDAPVTEEWRASLDFTPTSSMVVRLEGSHRRREGLLEMRDLVPDGAPGGSLGLRPARSSDYLFDHWVSGTLPDGTSYRVPVFRLASPGSGARALAPNGHVLETDDVELVVERPWRDGWTARLALYHASSRWRAKDGSEPGREPAGDPTPRLGVARDGDPFLAAPVHPHPAAGGAWLGDGWSAEATAGARLFDATPWGFDLRLAVHARQGQPLPWSAWDATSADGRPRLLRLDDPERQRLDDVITADLQLAKEIEIAGELVSVWTLDVLDLLDRRTAIQRQTHLAADRAGEVERRAGGRAVRLGFTLRWR